MNIPRITVNSEPDSSEWYELELIGPDACIHFLAWHSGTGEVEEWATPEPLVSPQERN